MIGGLRGTASSLAIAALLSVGATVFIPRAALAADLGGDCCADLEERVAELEATTVRSGNKKVKVTLYGQMNRVVNFWNDGFEQNTYVLNNSYSSSRFGMTGKTKISPGWTAGMQIEIEDEGNLSKFVDQFNDNPDNGSLNVRKSALYIASEKYGRVWLGQQETAKDNITKDTVVIKGLDKTMHADFYMNWSFFLTQKGFPGASNLSTIRYRDIGRCYSTSSSAFDCSTRRQEIRYDTPELWGFVASANWGEDDIWAAALRYTKDSDNWKIGAGYAYESFRDEGFNAGAGGVPFQGFKRDMEEWAGSFSILHKPTGLWVWGANSNSQDNDIGAKGVFTGQGPPVMHAYDIAGGLHKEWLPAGPTTVWGGYTWDQDGLGGFTRNSGIPSRAIWDGEVAAGAFPGIPFETEITSSETNKWYLAVNQHIESAAMDLFMAYQHITPEISLVTRDPTFSPTGKLRGVPIALEEFQVFFAGGRIAF